MPTLRLFADTVERFILTDNRIIDKPRYKLQILISGEKGLSWVDVPCTVDPNANIIVTDLQSNEQLVTN